MNAGVKVEEEGEGTRTRTTFGQLGEFSREKMGSANSVSGNSGTRARAHSRDEVGSRMLMMIILFVRYCFSSDFSSLFVSLKNL